MATARSLKKKQQQLRADQDLLADRWTEVLAAEEYKLERPSKSYPKRRLLPNLRRTQLNLHHQRTMRPIGHPVAATERPFGPQPKPHPGAAPRIPEHGEMQQTCETYWR